MQCCWTGIFRCSEYFDAKLRQDAGTCRTLWGDVSTLQPCPALKPHVVPGRQFHLRADFCDSRSQGRRPKPGRAVKMPTSHTGDDYKVGIICALPLERTAVEAMLDEMHESQPAIPGDSNVYSFGSIGKHNVLVASLGAGTYGTVSAAGVANDIRRSFPQLKYGLMVGIAGAMPRPESEATDIRLGDIVVGCINGVPSIVNYSLGKATVDGFEVRSELADPPEALSRAVAALQTQHQRFGPTYLTHLSNMLKQHPRLNQPKLKSDYYNIPDVADRLFNAQSDDFLDEGIGETKSISADLEVVRGPRSLRSPPDALTSEKFIRAGADGLADYPAVFLGSIGSADTLMKSANCRDAVFRMVKKQRKAELLCFEMEASGIVKGWPCLIIRGICDYSDSYKNDAWQNFAAATAAAYAKDLLIRIPTEAVARAKSVDEVAEIGKSRFDNMQESSNAN